MATQRLPCSSRPRVHALCSRKAGRCAPASTTGGLAARAAPHPRLSTPHRGKEQGLAEASRRPSSLLAPPSRRRSVPPQ
eukprot:8159322-Alexandrium_andersonii.AAC.1